MPRYKGLGAMDEVHILKFKATKDQVRTLVVKELESKGCTAREDQVMFYDSYWAVKIVTWKGKRVHVYVRYDSSQDEWCWWGMPEMLESAGIKTYRALQEQEV